MPDPNRMIAGLRCRDLLTLLSDYVDGLMSDVDRGRIEAHLSECGACTKFGGEYASVVGTLRRCAQPPEDDPELETRLRTRIEELWRENDADESSDPVRGSR